MVTQTLKVCTFVQTGAYQIRFLYLIRILHSCMCMIQTQMLALILEKLFSIPVYTKITYIWLCRCWLLQILIFFLQIYSFLFKELRKGAMYFAIKQILSRISKKSLLILELSRLKSFVAGIPTLLLQMFCYILCYAYVHTTYLISVRWSW